MVLVLAPLELSTGAFTTLGAAEYEGFCGMIVGTSGVELELV